jgi:hypothetical protein
MQSLIGRENTLPNSTCTEGYIAAVLRELTSSLRFCAKATGTRNESGDGAARDGRKIGRLRQGRAPHKLTADMIDRGRDKNLPRHHTLGGHQRDMLMAHFTIARRPNSQPWRDWSALAYRPEQFPECKSK